MILEDMRVFVDAGHGGTDSGAVSLDKQTKEKDITLYVANKINSILSNRGVYTSMTRTTDTYVPFENISAICNATFSDIFLSIHCNAGGGLGGTETYTHTTYDSYENDLATRINNNLVNVFGSPDRGVKRANYAVIRNNNSWAVLIELLFMDVSTDIAKLRDSGKLDSAAQAIVNALDSFVFANFRWD